MAKHGKAAVETEMRSCAVTLTQVERDERGTEMSACELEIERLKADRSKLTRAIKEQEKRRNELGHILESGIEHRDLRCSWVAVYNKNVWELKRPDTHEIVDTRAMTAEDRQEDLLPVEQVDVGTQTLELPPPPRSPKGERTPKKAAKHKAASSKSKGSKRAKAA